jgi:hypothetical protein
VYHLHLAFPFLPDRPADESERYWLERHGPPAVNSPMVAGGYVQTHRVDAEGPRPRYEGVAESWGSEQVSHDLYPLLTGPPPDFANFLDIANAAWAIGRDRHIVGDGAYGGPKTLHLLGSARDGAADAVEKALRGRTGPARRIVLWERDPAFRWHGTARIDLAVHAWADTPEAAAECGRELDALLSTVDGLGHVVSLRAEAIVLRPVTG